MSLSIMIGSEAQDYQNIKNTIHFLDALLESGLSVEGVDFSRQDQIKILNDLTKWYKSMYNLLTDSTLGLQEFYDPSDLLD
jgi:hypothetical protein